MNSSAIDREAEAILALGPDAGRRHLAGVLGRVAQYDQGSSAQSAALDFNAHLCTRVREIAEARGVRSPWFAA